MGPTGRDNVDVVNPPPSVALLPYPAAATALGIAVLTGLILLISSKFDRTNGPLTISIMVVLSMIGSVSYCLIFTVPQDDLTPGIIGGLTAGFGAVIAYWLGHKGGD